MVAHLSGSVLSSASALYSAQLVGLLNHTEIYVLEKAVGGRIKQR